MFREDFELLKTGTIHFDNAATTLKPRCIEEAFLDYVRKHTSNIHRGDYQNSIISNNKYEELKALCGDYLGVKPNTLAFTSGATHGLNQVILGYYRYKLKKGDKVLISSLEHASNFVPWLILKEEIGIELVKAPVKDLKLDIDSIDFSELKVISLAHVTNTTGEKRDLEKLSKLASNYNIDLVIDGAQGFSKERINLEKLNAAFYVNSFHKAYGPTGLGILYKRSDIQGMKPLIYGGGMNDTFDFDGFSLKDYPYNIEAGTLNVSAIYEALISMQYLISKDIKKLYDYSSSLKDYLVHKLEAFPNIIIYNKDIHGSILLFNVKGVFPQDVAIFLDKYHINIRSGNHCVKTINEEIDTRNTCRISLDFYNTKEEIDALTEAFKNLDKLYEIVI